MATTFMKLRSGQWGLRGPQSALQPGATVTVAKRDGSSKECTVGRILWNRDGIALATISASGYQRETGCRSSHDQTEREMCAECGERHAVTTAADSSGCVAGVCRRCAQLTPWERSYC
jgi:hypothetical protein